MFVLSSPLGSATDGSSPTGTYVFDARFGQWKTHVKRDPDQYVREQDQCERYRQITTLEVFRKGFEKKTKTNFR